MKKEQEQYLNLLLNAHADVFLDEREMRIILRFAGQYGISNEEIEQLLERDEQVEKILDFARKHGKPDLKQQVLQQLFAA